MEEEKRLPDVAVSNAVKKKVAEILSDDTKDASHESTIASVDDIDDDHVTRAYKIDVPMNPRSWTYYLASITPNCTTACFGFESLLVSGSHCS